MDGDKREDGNSRTAAFPSTTTDVAMATACPGSSVCTRAPSSSLSVISPDRQAVQVIQHAIQRPQTMAARFLHQMYAAQQQHLMLQTAALQQHQHGPHLQSLATIHQASVCQRQSASSSGNGLIRQPPGVSIALPTSPVTAQLVGRTQNSISNSVSTTISQQAMLLGGRPANCNQAQMYLRTQMLILTPAASVAAVQSDLPAITSCSSASNSSQVQNLVLHHLPGALATAHNVILKPPPQCPALAPVYPLKSGQVTESSSERGQPEVTRPQALTPALSPVQTSLKQQRSCPHAPQGAPQPLTLQQAMPAAVNHRHLQPVSLSRSPQDTVPDPPPFPSQSQSSPSALSQTTSHSPASSSLSSLKAEMAIPAARIYPLPPPLMAAPQPRSLFPQVQGHPPPPPPPLASPRFSQNPPATLQRLPLHPAKASASQAWPKEQVGLVRIPHQDLPPPQTVAVDLKVQPGPPSEAPSSGQTNKGIRVSPRKEEDGSPHLPPPNSPPFPGTLKPIGAAEVDTSHSRSCSSTMRPPEAKEQPQLTTRGGNRPSPSPSPSQPAPTLPAAVRQPPSSPGSPEGPLTTHVLTHLVEGFVIQEGLEPFPVVTSSLLTEKQASLPDCQEIRSNQDAAVEESPLEANQTDSSDSEMENHDPAVDVTEHSEGIGGVLRCEYCGGRGHARTFLHSKRFCSMTCVRRFSKHITLLRAGRLGHRATGRRGRPPSRVNGACREHFLKRVYRSGRSRRDEGQEEEEEEDEAPPPMTTRLRKQAERQREKDREQEREQEELITETISISDEGEEDRCPSDWDVERVFSYINSLPGGGDAAEQFRSQQIDGQALLLLTEDHLVSTLNLKLGPALKLCAHINSLKDV